MRNKIFRWVGFLLLVLNLLIFINRKKGFNYQEIATLKQLYPQGGSFDLSERISGTNFHFSPNELVAAKKLLMDSTDLTGCRTDIERLLCINHYIHRTICQNHAIGRLTKTYEAPMQLFLALKTNKQEPFYCGHAAYLQAYFLTAVGFKVRHIQNLQRPHSPIAPDSHVFNEVWIPELNKWVISDLFQNRHLLVKGDTLLTGADLYHDQALNKPSPITIYYSDQDSIAKKLETLNDPFFSKHYYLNYYQETDPALVYTWKRKFQHYILSYSHFQLYDPIEEQSNTRYYLKQALFFAGLGWLIIFVVRTILHSLDRIKKHTKII